MKQRLTTLCTIIILFYSCSTKVNVAAPYRNITVVYGLLDNADTPAHYIRIQKAFLSQTKSAYDMAKVSDSSFYPQLNVILEGISNNNIVSVITLTRIDLNTVGYQKDSGAFFTSPNYAYQFTGSLDPAYRYRLVITNPTTGEIDSAETTVIDENPSVFTCSAIDGKVNHLSFIPSSQTLTITGRVPPTVPYVQGILRVRWIENNSQLNTTVKKYSDWYLGSSAPVADAGANFSGFKFEVDNSHFYFFVQDAMQPAPPFVTRLIDSAYFYLYAVNQDLYDYMQATQTIGTGLTGMDIEPIYSRILSNKGTGNTLGIFASRAVKSGPVLFDDATIDSLMANPLFSNLNVRGTTY